MGDSKPMHLGKGVACEMNKFDEMMGYLSAHDKKFAQVVAVDAEINLFTRAWCVSELARAHATGMKQHLKLLNARALETHSERLRTLKIEEMQAARKEDTVEILA